MVLFSIRKISKDDKNWSSQRLFRKFSGKNWAWTSVDRLLKNMNFTGVTKRPKGSNRPRSVRTSEFRKTSNLWRSSSAVMKVLGTSTKIRWKLEERWTLHGRLFSVLLSMIFATLFSEVVSNKLRGNATNEITLICTKFGDDLVNTSKVTSRKKVTPFSLAHPVYIPY